MEQQDKIDLLLSLQEHPESFTNEQIESMLAEDCELTELIEQLATTKRAFTKQEVAHELIPIDELWKNFATEHATAFDKQEKTMRRFAACFIGILCTAVLAFATIHVVNHINQQPQQPVHIQKPIPSKSSTPSTSHHGTKKITNDTLYTAQPIVFDNVTLEKMLDDIAPYYQTEVMFLNEDARQLRFYFEWKHEETLDHVLQRLNNFESVEIEMNNHKIIVK